MSQVQAQAILEMQLRRLAALERKKIEDEYQEILARIIYLEDLLLHPDKVRTGSVQNMLALKEKFGDERRTAIVHDASGEFSEEDLHRTGQCPISYSANAYIKRMAADSFLKTGAAVTGSKACLPATRMW